MFTGIIEEAGRIHTLTRGEQAIRMVVRAETVARGARIGESIAVNGCCLTVVRKTHASGNALLCFDLLEETWRRTSFAQLGIGRRVNLERALQVRDRLGGHFVTGHVDGAGEIVRWELSGADWLLEVRPPPELMRHFVYKGSVAIDGISLTVADVLPDRIRVWIIPHTWKVTNLSERKLGDRVNLETDLIGKYVERLMADRAGPAAMRAEGRTPSSKARSAAPASQGSRPPRR
jgi:riboflavin synthase